MAGTTIIWRRKPGGSGICCDGTALAQLRCMILPASRPMDFAGMFGAEASFVSQNSLPVAIEMSKEDLLKSLNPLHHLPLVGTIYRAATGENVPLPIRVLGAGITGGPAGMMGAAFMGL